MRFSDVIGHEEVKQRLRGFVDSGRIPHALMLAGLAGIGKMRMARAFAQYIACQNKHDGDSCGVCAACRQIHALNFPDIYYSYPIVAKGSKAPISSDYDRQWRVFMENDSYMPFKRWMLALDAGNTQPVIYVSEAGEILQRMSVSTFSSPYKLNIIWLPEKMNVQTANKLLKLIEEPYPDTLFLLVSNDPEGVLPTIRSRAQTVLMRPLNSRIIAAQLQSDTGVDAETATSAARLAQGNYATALETATNAAEPAEFRDIFQEVMRMAYSRNARQLKMLSETLAAMGRDKSRRFLQYMGSMLRENLIYNLHNPELTLLSPPEEAFSSRFSPFVNEANIRPMSDAVSAADIDIARNANAKIVFFDLMLHIMVNIRKK